MEPRCRQLLREAECSVLELERQAQPGRLSTQSKGPIWLASLCSFGERRPPLKVVVQPDLTAHPLEGQEAQRDPLVLQRSKLHKHRNRGGGHARETVSCIPVEGFDKSERLLGQSDEISTNFDVGQDLNTCRFSLVVENTRTTTLKGVIS